MSESGVRTAMDWPSADAPDSIWLRDRLTNSIWREDEVAGRVVDVRIRQKRQSRNGTTALCAIGLSGADGEPIEQLYLLHEVSPESLMAEAQMLSAEATITPRLGRAVTVVPEANLLLVAFPNDRQMRLVTDAALRKWLSVRATSLANQGGRGPRWQLKESTCEVLRYAPGQRLTMRCKGTHGPARRSAAAPPCPASASKDLSVADEANEGGDDDVEQGERQQHLPGDAHQLVKPEPGQGCPQPDVEKEEDDHLGDEPEDAEEPEPVGAGTIRAAEPILGRGVVRVHRRADCRIVRCRTHAREDHALADARHSCGGPVHGTSAKQMKARMLHHRRVELAGHAARWTS